MAITRHLLRYAYGRMADPPYPAGLLPGESLPRGQSCRGAEASRRQDHSLSPGGEMVLVVEDEPAVRALAAPVLRTCGYTVLEAADGEKAIRLAYSVGGTPVQMLLTDVILPRLNGPAARQLRALFRAA